MGIVKHRMSSFVERGNRLIDKGKTPDAMKLIEKGLEEYSKNVMGALSPYAKSDAGLIVLVLRHLADEIETNNPGAKELYEGMKKCVVAPTLYEKEKIKKPNRR